MEIISITGPTGSGKTTLLRAIKRGLGQGSALDLSGSQSPARLARTLGSAEMRELTAPAFLLLDDCREAVRETLAAHPTIAGLTAVIVHEGFQSRAEAA